jgi:hypothetical protein
MCTKRFSAASVPHVLLSKYIMVEAVAARKIKSEKEGHDAFSDHLLTTFHSLSSQDVGHFY